MNSIKIYIKEIAALIGRPKQLIPLVISMGTLLGIIDIVCLILLSKLVGGISQNVETLAIGPSSFSIRLAVSQAGVLLVAIYVFRAILGICFNYLIFYRTGQVEAHLRANIIERFMRMPYESRLKRPLGSLVTTANQWPISFVRGVLAPLLRFICDAAVGILILSYFTIQYPDAVLLFLVATLALGFTYDRTLRRLATENANKFRTISEHIAEGTEQALAGYKEIQVLQLTSFFRRKLYEQSRAMGRALAIANTIGQSPRLIIEATLIIVSVVLLLFIARSGHSITDQLPEIAMLTFALLRVSSLVSLATATAANLRLYRGVVHQLYSDLCGAMNPVQASETNLEFESLEIEKVSFKYNSSRSPVLENVTVKLNHGEALVIVGDSGSGKTTLVDLMLGILDPTAGSIRVVVRSNGKPATHTNLTGLATYLSQTGFILNDTIRQNIALGQDDSDIKDEKILDALRKAKLDAFATVEQLGIKVGDRGAKLSGGQRQRLILARAFYLGHKVMILDEATNAIDLATEIEIIKDLLSLQPEVTLIAITHRLEIAKLFSKSLNLTERRPK